VNQQEEHWNGEPGNAYHQRSPGDEEANYHLFRKALACADLKYNCSILELGCGTGANLRALQRCFSSPKLTGVEINRKAIEAMPTYARAIRASILDWQPDDEWDLTFTRGVLIHIAPDDLPAAYKTLVQASNRYVLVAEYYSPQPRMIPYRGVDDRLWARPFAEEIIKAHGLQLVDYGFVSKMDRNPQDDLTWFLMEKP
jgi:pseudaminic acid biosynthesis-associated methylase